MNHRTITQHRPISVAELLAERNHQAPPVGAAVVVAATPIR
jgi:hypothetical protein